MGNTPDILSTKAPLELKQMADFHVPDDQFSVLYQQVSETEG